MTTSTRREQGIGGVWAPIVTPLDRTLAIDHARLAAHASRVIENGAAGVVLFGTTGEAPSFSVAERVEALDALLSGGFPAARVIVGTGCSALVDTVTLTQHAGVHRVAAVLIVPPFYFKSVSDEGVVAAFAYVLERAGGAAPPVLLYHFPRLSGVPISPGVIEALRERFHDRIAGIKDSGGDASHTRDLCRRFPELAVFPGNENGLDQNLDAGAAGCITATANVAAAPIARFIGMRPEVRAAEGGALFEEIVARRRALERYPMIAALKAILAERLADPGWARVRPPLVALTERVAL